MHIREDRRHVQVEDAALFGKKNQIKPRSFSFRRDGRTGTLAEAR